MFFVGLFVLQFAVMLFLEQEDNLLLVRPDAEIASALTDVQKVVLIVASLGCRVRDRRALAFGLAAAPASAAAEPGREPERRPVRRLAHHAACWTRR